MRGTRYRRACERLSGVVVAEQGVEDRRGSTVQSSSKVVRSFELPFPMIEYSRG